MLAFSAFPASRHPPPDRQPLFAVRPQLALGADVAVEGLAGNTQLLAQRADVGFQWTHRGLRRP